MNTMTMSRLEAFLSPQAPEVFHGISHQNEVWHADPFDVPEIHARAREVFEGLIQRATASSPPNSGRILLVKGRSGCGKTHLMRAFRNRVHEQVDGYVGYMQMTTRADNYTRYILANLIHALDRPYSESNHNETSLLRLSNQLMTQGNVISTDEQEQLQSLDGKPLRDLVWGLSLRLLDHCPALAGVDTDLISGLLFLQRRLPSLQNAVLRLLRGAELSENERALIGGIVPRSSAEDARSLLAGLARIVHAVGQGALVVCVDQIEEIYALESGADEHFRNVVQTLTSLIDAAPTAVVVMACLEDYYGALQSALTRSAVDRIELDPAPVHLSDHLSFEQTKAVIATRLQYLFESLDAEFDETEPLDPFDPKEFEQLRGMRVRDVLEACRKARAAAMLRSERPKIVAGEPTSPGTPPPDEDDFIELEQAWNEHISSFDNDPPDSEEALASLLAHALLSINTELDTGHALRAEAKANTVTLRIEGADGQVVPAEMLVGICDKGARGGGLGRQVQALQDAAQDRPCSVVRSIDFPSNPKTKIAQQLGKIIAAGGRRTICENSAWRQMLAMQDFERSHASDAQFSSWRKSRQPLLQLPPFQELLRPEDLRKKAPCSQVEELDELVPIDPPAQEGTNAPEQGAAPSTSSGSPTGSKDRTEPAKPKDQTSSRQAQNQQATGRSSGEDRKSQTGESAPPELPIGGPILLGKQLGLRASPVQLEPDHLRRHAAILGGSGSGKTTLALAILESLLERGIPVILVDRKGDLCTYADPSAWELPLEDKTRMHRRAALREQTDVRLYTPGHPGGRDLALAILPSGVQELSSFDQEKVFMHAASALNAMIDGGNKNSKQSRERLAVLRKALSTLVEIQDSTDFSIDELIHFIASEDPALVGAIGVLDRKLLQSAAAALQTLAINDGALLAADPNVERISAERLLGKDQPSGRAQLSIISTRALGDTDRVLFWMTHFLMELSRYASRSPSDELQAVVMFDEADLYLPAGRKPPTKEPLESALKRFRSAGIGILLATQSPGDLDYKCRENVHSWFLGKITQDTALKKIQPMFEGQPGILERIPAQTVGHFHFLQDGRAQAIQAHPSLIRAVQYPDDEIIELARQA
jgi:energy-coupling factor transporter ATP-binding protein EcfA2